jgi:hypothetical protein
MRQEAGIDRLEEQPNVWDNVKFEPIEGLPDPETFNAVELSRREQLIEFINSNNLTNPSHEEKNMIIRYAYDELGYRFKSTADWYEEINEAIDEINSQYDELMDAIEIESQAAPKSIDEIIDGSLLE